MEQQQPLISQVRDGEREEDKRSAYQFLGRSGSVHVPSADVSMDEIRVASFAPASYYPPSPYAGTLVASHVPDVPYGHTIFPQDGSRRHEPIEAGRPLLDEVEIRQLLLDHVGKKCCWGNEPARKWRISVIEDCNVYVGTLEIFIEERDTIAEKEPHTGGKLDGKDIGPEVGLWELDLTSKFPPLFVPCQEIRVKLPHSEALEKCQVCEGRGETLCPSCNAHSEPGFYRANQLTQCTTCYGRGLLAHKDGSDTICQKCGGKGVVPCGICGSCGLVKCQTCSGAGSLLTRSVAQVRWRTLTSRKVNATSAAASVPEEVFHRAKGIQLCNTQAYQCTPAFFADSYFLNKFSSEVVGDRSPIPQSARLICERHIISVVPVARVTMNHGESSFSFYIVGMGREIFMRNYPSSCCWGLCCCFQWLNI